MFIISDVLGTYYEMCTLSWLKKNGDSIFYKKKKKCVVTLFSLIVVVFNGVIDRSSLRICGLRLMGLWIR